MSLDRFRDEDGNICVDEDFREYVRELSPVDRIPDPPELPLDTCPVCGDYSHDSKTCEKCAKVDATPTHKLVPKDPAKG